MILWNWLFEGFAKINELRKAKRLPRVVSVFDSNITFYFSLLSDESGGWGFAMAYQRLHDLVIFVHFIAVFNSGEPLKNVR